MACPYCDDESRSRAASCQSCGANLLIGGQVQLEELVGRGPGSRVYRGSLNGQTVAVKALLLTEADWSSGESFRKGGEALRAFAHPSLPKYHAFFEDERGTLFLVREHFAGSSLAERVENHRRIESAAFTILLESLLGVAHYLHSLVPPALHCNIKPSNILFRADSSWIPVLVDFESSTQPDQDFSSFGTPGFTAPEVANGQLDQSTDLYAIGASLLYLATHQHPDDLPRNAQGFQVEDKLGQLEANARRVLLRLVATDPKQRFSTAAAAMDELRAVPLQPGSQRERAPARGSLGAWVGAAILLAMAPGILFAGMSVAEWLRAKATADCQSDGLAIQADEQHGHCLHLLHGEPAVLGCSQERRRVEHYCRVASAMPGTKKGELDSHELRALLSLAKKLELDQQLDAKSEAQPVHPSLPLPTAKPKLVIQPSEQPSRQPVQTESGSTEDSSGVAIEAPTTPPVPEAPVPSEPGQDLVEVLVETTPPGATIAVLEQSCVSPCTIKVAKGESMMLELSKPGYRNKSQKVRALSTKTISVKLEPSK